MSPDKMKTYLHFHKTCKHQTWHIGDLLWDVSTHKFVWPSITYYHMSCKKIKAFWSKDDGLISSGHVRALDKLKTFFFPPNSACKTFKGWCLGWRTSGYQVILPFVYRAPIKLKIQMKIQNFIPQGSRIAKLGWEKTYCEKWCDQIIRSMAQIFNALGSCLYHQNITSLCLYWTDYNFTRMNLEMSLDGTTVLQR